MEKRGLGSTGLEVSPLGFGGAPVGYLQTDRRQVAEILNMLLDRGVKLLNHEVTLHWLVNDIFMIFFFGIAAKEITESCLPGGSLNPLRKAVNPLFATLGGVVGPVVVFFAGLFMCFELGIYTPADDIQLLARGWGIPTATDIALAWLVARTVFGKGHPAVNFLLLLAVADDAIGLVIIAVFYGSVEYPPEPVYLVLVVLASLLAYLFRRAGITKWWLYVGLAGPISLPM